MNHELGKTPFEQIVELQVKQALLEAMKVALDKRERRLLKLRFGLDGRAPKTLTQLGKKEGVTVERIRQIILRATSKLRRGEPCRIIRTATEGR